jgi:hypothetical protein
MLITIRSTSRSKLYRIELFKVAGEMWYPLMTARPIVKELQISIIERSFMAFVFARRLTDFNSVEIISTF